jgi:PilZ domain
LVKAPLGRSTVHTGKRRTIGTRGISPEANIVYDEKRRGPRYTFIASAELVDERADVRIASRVSELSLHGCYLDMMNPFPKETMVLVKIAAGDAFFEAKAKVIYSQPNMGAGLGFLQVAPDSQAVLERWLDEADREQKRLAG